MSHGHHTDQEAFKCCISQVDGEKQQGGLRLFLKALITFNRTKRSPDHRQRSRPSRQLPPLIKSQSCETAVTRTCRGPAALCPKPQEWPHALHGAEASSLSLQAPFR